MEFVKPLFPSPKELEKLLYRVRQNDYFTNYGPETQLLERKVSDFLQKPVSLVANGTLALHIALKLLPPQQEIITTPFSYYSSVSSILWEKYKPVFVDIDPKTLQIDAGKIEEKITKNTSGILAVHLFGGSCEVEKLNSISQKHNLSLIYDAAHGFGTTYKNKPLSHFGDAITYSFNATKFFHCVEGGAIAFNDEEKTKAAIALANMKSPVNKLMINAKLSEIHAVIGLWNLERLFSLLAQRKTQWTRYAKNLLTGNRNFFTPEFYEDVSPNYSYFPIIFESQQLADTVIKSFSKANIKAKRYFYPTLSVAFGIDDETPIASSLAGRCICLPLFHDLTSSEQDQICELILHATEK